MPVSALKAHYDGQHILLDDPFDLPVNAQLLITVLPSERESDLESWLTIASESLASAYGDEEPEYSTADVKS